MLRKAEVCALDQVLLERYRGKVSRGLAVELSRRHDFPNVRNFYLPRPSRATVGRMNTRTKQGIMAKCKH